MNNIDNWLDAFRTLNPNTIEEDAKVEKKKSTLTLDKELPAMDFGNKNFYRDLSEEHKKEIGLWVLMRFMSSSQGMPEHHIMMVNDLVNHNFSNLTKHPELQWKLLALCGSGRKQYHPWIPPPKGVKKNKIEQEILKIRPLMNDSELELFLYINTTEDFEQFFKDNGYDDKTIKDLLKGDGKNK